MIKSLVRRTLENMGYEVKRLSNAVQPGYNSQYLSMFGSPKLVFDVGVGYGTPELYRACPSAKFILIEPLLEFEEAINEICCKYDCKVYYKAVSHKKEKNRMFKK